MITVSKKNMQKRAGDCNVHSLAYFCENGGAMTQNKVKNIDGKVGEGVKFERIRRITGYLVGTLERFNDAKASEVKERVKHGLGK